MIGRLHHVALDCRDPATVAAFYSELLGLPITYRSEDWVVVAANESTSGLAFQLAPGHTPPTWPDPTVPQQIHLDIMVEDPAEAGSRVLALGATRLPGEGVYADPAGHPFCLVRRPRWAPPIPDDNPVRAVLGRGMWVGGMTPVTGGLDAVGCPALRPADCPSAAVRCGVKLPQRPAGRWRLLGTRGAYLERAAPTWNARRLLGTRGAYLERAAPTWNVRRLLGTRGAYLERAAPTASRI